MKPSYIPRLSKNSQKAGKVQGLESNRIRAPEPLELGWQNKKPSQLKEERRRVSEEEKQVEDLVFYVEPEEPEFQTNRNLPAMVKEKSMIIPGSRDAPKFQSARPRELRRFIRQLEDLWKEAGIVKDQEKKESIGKYADQESEEEWSALETYNDGYTWAEFKKELLDNYPEASAAERGTPARIRQIVRDADNLELGDAISLYAYRRAFLAEASKLKKPPMVMSNRELVELFMGGLSMSMGQAILQHLGGSTRTKASEKPEATEGVTDTVEARRPEDRYDLDEVCRAAGEVSENAQGMLSYKWGPTVSGQGQKKGSSLVQNTFGGTSDLASRLESIEGNQALEKDKADAQNKQLGARLESIEGLIKTVLSTNQEKPPASFVQHVGQGSKTENRNEEAQKTFKSFSNSSELTCFGCGSVDHFQNNCERVKALFARGAIVRNREGRVCLPDGSKVPNVPFGACLVERVEKYYASKRLTQSYYGTFEDMEDKLGGNLPRGSTYVNREVDERELKLAKLEKELELRERESALLAKQLKLENKASEKPDVRSFLLERFDEELAALQSKPGFL